MHFVVAILLVGTLLSGPPAARPTVAWHGCATGATDPLGAAPDAAGAQCAEVTVPVDYRRPHWRTMTVALSRIRATDPAHRRGALVINPGGPGVPAMEQVLLG